MILGFPEEFGDNPPSSLFHLLTVEQQIHWQQTATQYNTTSTMLDGRSRLWRELYTYKQLSVQLILGPVTALKWLQVTLLTCSNQ